MTEPRTEPLSPDEIAALRARWGATEVAWACKSAGVDPSEILTLLLENTERAVDDRLREAGYEALATLDAAQPDTRLPDWLTPERLAEAMRRSEAVPLGYGLADTAARILAALAETDR